MSIHNFATGMRNFVAVPYSLLRKSPGQTMDGQTMEG